MNGFNDKDELVRELQQRSHDVDGHPIGLDAVKRSAQKIRRRRNLVSGAVAALVAAVAVPASLAVSNGLVTAEGPVGPADNSPSATPSGSQTSDPTPTPAPTPAPTPGPDGSFELALDGLARGENPAITYLLGRTVHLPEDTDELPRRYDGLTPYGDGWLAQFMQTGEGGFAVDTIDGDGEVVATRPANPGFAVSADGGRTAYVVTAGGGSARLELVTSDGTGTPTSIEVPADASAVGFLAADTVVYRTEGENPRTWVTDFNETREIPGAMGATATSPSLGLIAVQTSYNDDGTSCWRVLTASSKKQAESCEHRFEAFSPDGSHLVGTPSDSDGLGPSSVSILDAATGEPVVTYRRSGTGDTFVGDVVWEDAEHVLASVYDHGTWQLVRMDLRGNLEAVSDEASDGNDPPRSPFHFADRP